jgi:hypothetical protein
MLRSLTLFDGREVAMARRRSGTHSRRWLLRELPVDPAADHFQLRFHARELRDVEADEA